MNKIINQFKKLPKLLKRFLLGTTLLLVLNFFGALNLIRDGVLLLYDLATPEPEEYVSEIDGNTRGIILSSAKADKKPITIQYGRHGLKFSREDLILGKDDVCLNDFIGISKSDCLIRFELGEDNRLLISGNFYDTEQCLMATVDKGQFIVSPDCTFTHNLDDYAFEIVDSNFNVVFSIDSIGDNEIVIEGAFVTDSKYVIIAGGIMAVYPSENVDLEVFNHNRKNIRPIFQYHGRDWYRERITD